MSKENYHFRGDSFGNSGVVEKSSDEYLQNLLGLYKACLVLEKSGKTPEELVMYVRGIEREISLLDSWNAQLEEIVQVKELDIERLNEDIMNLDDEVIESERQRQELEIRLDMLEEQKIVKDQIIQKQEHFLKERSMSSQSLLKNTSTRSEKKFTPKTARNRYESPSLV